MSDRQGSTPTCAVEHLIKQAFKAQFTLDLLPSMGSLEPKKNSTTHKAGASWKLQDM